MPNFLLALAITITILTISSVTSPKLKAAIYSLPIPITVILLGTGGHVNTTHLTGLVFILVFMTLVWRLHKISKIHIILSILIGVLVYVLLGLLGRFIIKAPFLIGYISVVIAWLIFRITPIKLNAEHYKGVKVSLGRGDYAIRGVLVFFLAYMVISIKGLIFGAAVTFPFNGIFTTYIMRDQLPVLITEQIRNFIALFSFFLTVWALQPKIGLIQSVAVGWIVCASLIYLIVRYLPRQYK